MHRKNDKSINPSLICTKGQHASQFVGDSLVFYKRYYYPYTL